MSGPEASEPSDTGATTRLSGGAPVSEHIDHRRLLDEIDAEVRRRRESGDLPADVECELDLAFARFAPVNAVGDGFDQLLDRAEHASFVDAQPPVVSPRPAVRRLKRLVHRAVVWEVRHVAMQVTAFASAITEAVRQLGARVDALEGSPPAVAPAPAGIGADAVLDLARWASVVTAAMVGSRGRVLHAGCGDGSLVAALSSAGIDAYGVDGPARLPAKDRADGWAAGGDVRAEDPLAHLRGLDDRSLGGLVLSGCVDQLPPAAQAALAGLAAAKLAPGGSVVVLGIDPGAWGRDRSAVEVDLAAGRPLHPATWRFLLTEAGLEDPVVVEADRPGEDEAGAATYAVLARRARATGGRSLVQE